MSLRVVNAGRHLNEPEIFEAEGIEFVQYQVTPQTSKADYINILRDADGAMITTLPLTDGEVLEACPDLKVVSRSGVGVDSVDLPTATRLGILVCYTPGVNSTEVADHAMAQLLALTRNIRELDAAVKAGKWSNAPQEVRAIAGGLRRIAGSTVGFGAIGRTFSMRIRGFGRYRRLAEPAALVGLDIFAHSQPWRTAWKHATGVRAAS